MPQAWTAQARSSFFSTKRGRNLHASHVHLYLGKEADGHAIMIGSSERRSYRHHKIDGFGITDYHVPATGSKTRIIAYGPPPPFASKESPPTATP
jgi:hypothetical protein